PHTHPTSFHSLSLHDALPIYPAIFTNEEYEMWIRAALAGFAFTRYTRPLGWYSHRPDSLSASETRMLRGILRVLAKTRPVLAPDSPEIAILEHQVVRFRAEIAAAERKERLQRVEARRGLSLGWHGERSIV